MGSAGRGRRPPHAPRGEDGVDLGQGRVFQNLPRRGRDEDRGGPSSVVDGVDPPVPAAAVHDGVAALAHPRAEPRGATPPWWEHTPEASGVPLA